MVCWEKQQHTDKKKILNFFLSLLFSLRYERVRVGCVIIVIVVLCVIFILKKIN